jgi:hypothetical protein
MLRAEQQQQQQPPAPAGPAGVSAGGGRTASGLGAKRQLSASSQELEPAATRQRPLRAATPPSMPSGMVARYLALQLEMAQAQEQLKAHLQHIASHQLQASRRAQVSLPLCKAWTVVGLPANPAGCVSLRLGSGLGAAQRFQPAECVVLTTPQDLANAHASLAELLLELTRVPPAPAPAPLQLPTAPGWAVASTAAVAPPPAQPPTALGGVMQTPWPLPHMQPSAAPTAPQMLLMQQYAGLQALQATQQAAQQAAKGALRGAPAQQGVHQHQHHLHQLNPTHGQQGPTQWTPVGQPGQHPQPRRGAATPAVAPCGPSMPTSNPQLAHLHQQQAAAAAAAQQQQQQQRQQQFAAVPEAQSLPPRPRHEAPGGALGALRHGGLAPAPEQGWDVSGLNWRQPVVSLPADSSGLGSPPALPGGQPAGDWPPHPPAQPEGMPPPQQQQQQQQQPQPQQQRNGPAAQALQLLNRPGIGPPITGSSIAGYLANEPLGQVVHMYQLQNAAQAATAAAPAQAAGRANALQDQPQHYMTQKEDEDLRNDLHDLLPAWNGV